MVKVELGSEKTEELYDADVFEGYDFEHDGETYSYITESDSSMDDNGKYESLIYQRESDGKYFKLTIAYARYGYENYSYESFLNDGEMYEVEKKERVVVDWVKTSKNL